MPSYNIVVFAGDYAGPEVWSSTCTTIGKCRQPAKIFDPGHSRSSEGMNSQTVGRIHERHRLMGVSQILRVVEKERPEIKFNFQDHLLGGVRFPPTTLPQRTKIAEYAYRLQLMPVALL